MGLPDSSVLDLIEKVRSRISWGTSDLNPSSLSCKFDMADKSFKMCCECQMNFIEPSQRFCCQDCGRLFCLHCVQSGCSIGVVASDDLKSIINYGVDIKSCKFCSKFGLRHQVGRRYSDKVYPAESPRESPEPPSPSFSGEKFDGCSSHAVTRSSVTSFTGHPSPASRHHSPSRSDEDEFEDSANSFSSSTEYFHDTSDIYSSSVSARNEFYSFMSVGSSPSDSPSRIPILSSRVGQFVHKEQGVTLGSHYGPCDQQTVAVLKRPQTGTEFADNANDCADLPVFWDQCGRLQKPLDFENDGLIWFPPPPNDEDDEAENNFFSYDDEDDEIGESGGVFSSSGSMFPGKEKQNEVQKEPLRTVVRGHFRALVSQLLQGEGIKVGKEDSTEDWLDIVTKLAWQAANFVKPDTSKGGSMDPGDYVKVKGVASGSPSESTFVKGVVCTKNIKHKRMTSQYKSPRLLILGGALEYQRVPNQLASFDTLLQQEMDHLKMIVSKIESRRPNVLLVEKSVSSYAQEYILAKEISLVSNVKRPLLERIARCTGALITPSVDHISTARVGHCELFCLEKVSEEHEPANLFHKKPSKTLMFFEGCPRRLGCTVLLRGSCREELIKVKHVVQYAVFAAYHLSLQTSFLADEGASLPKMAVQPPIVIPKKTTADYANLAVSSYVVEAADVPNANEEPWSHGLNRREWMFPSEYFSDDNNYSPTRRDCEVKNGVSASHDNNVASFVALNDLRSTVFPSEIWSHAVDGMLESTVEESQMVELSRIPKLEQIDESEGSTEYYSTTDSHQNILVSFSSRCVLNGTVCERSRLLRIKFYGYFDKPLGKYLCDDLFDQTSHCHSCKEPSEAHVICYTHRQGNLTINVRRLPSVRLPGESDGKIWMWHRCLKCAQIDGVPPATRRVVMSDAAWGFSFGKFLELGFSNHATANRVASCGHSLQRDCLRYYGFGSMVAFFRYSPVEILSVRLPPSVLEFNGCNEQEWIKKEVAELLYKMEVMYGEILAVLNCIEQKNACFGLDLPDGSDLSNEIMELREQLMKEKSDYNDLLQPACKETSDYGQVAVDILELNRLRKSLLIGSHVWDHRLDSLDSLLKRRNSVSKDLQVAISSAMLQNCGTEQFITNGSVDQGNEESVPKYSKLEGFPKKDVQQEAPSMPSPEPIVAGDLTLTSFGHNTEEVLSDGEITVRNTSLECAPSNASNLSDKIDSLWIGTDQPTQKAFRPLPADGLEVAPLQPPNQMDSPPFRGLASPARVYSFDSAMRIQERIRKGLPPSSLHLTKLRSFHASGDYRTMIRDPVHNLQRTYSQISPRYAQKLNLLLNTSLSFISPVSLLPEGARLMLPQNGYNDIVIAVYDNEPTSIISYALSSREYEEWVADKPNGLEGGLNGSNLNKENSIASNFSGWNSFGSLDLDYIGYGGHASENALTTMNSLFTDPKSYPHLKISFEDDSNAQGKVKFSVTCYFAKQFGALRKKCCPTQVDFVCSLSRCRRWSAQGGKSNVYFAKSLDERFIIKQVTKTELDSFEEFAPQYFRYLKDSLSSGSPTCLAKVLGIYQVTVKHMKGGKETKMDLMVMENLFFKRNISRIYDLKGSARSRYNADTTGTNIVLLDMNLLETLRTQPIFLGSKAKRSLERAVWNDTNFLASVDVMDYSLLVGLDDERKELVLGIIDFMRQYTWDKHLETWVKASGILGGPRNASPTIISPKQYKKRFRKAMTTYFLTVPDQWGSS